jgi:hypothetical protein
METFKELMFETLEETVRMILGENISQLINSLKQRQTSLKLNENGNNNDVNITYLEKLLGKEGAQIIQAISIKRLYLKLKREFEEVEKYFVFLDELYEMKFRLLVSSSKKSSPCN